MRQVPAGHVATYGQIAAVVGTNPRIVGFAMAGCPDDVPWHRIVNSRGEVSVRSAGDGASRQRALLREEGIRLDRKGRLDLDTHGWLPR